MALTHTRPWTAGLATTATVALAATAMAVAGAGPAGALTRQHVVLGGGAYGSTAHVGSLAGSGRTADTSICTTDTSAHHADRSAAVDLGAVGHVGAVTTQERTSTTRSIPSITASSHTARTSLLGGVIRLDAVSTAATLRRDGTHLATSGTSTFVGLRIAGRAVAAHPKPNTVIDVPGLARVVINAQARSAHHGWAGIAVTALAVTVSRTNTMHLPATTVVVGHSSATMATVDRVPTAAAYATQVSVGGAVRSGATAPVYTPCGGTGDVTRSNPTARVTIKDVAGIRAARSSVRTTDTASRTTSTGQNRITGADLLGGAVTIEALTTRATAVRTSSGLTVSASGTRLVGLRIDGHAVASPRMGTHRTVRGLGTLYFGTGRRIRDGVEVYGLRLVLGHARGGFPAGASLTVGYARAAVGS